MTLPPEVLKQRMAEHSQRNNAKTAINAANMSAEKLEEWKEKAAGRNRKCRAKMKGERKEGYKAKNQERTRKRCANGAYDMDEEEKEEYDSHGRDTYAKKRKR